MAMLDWRKKNNLECWAALVSILVGISIFWMNCVWNILICPYCPYIPYKEGCLHIIFPFSRKILKCSPSLSNLVPLKPCFSQTLSLIKPVSLKPCLSQTLSLSNPVSPKPCLSQTLSLSNPVSLKPCLSQTLSLSNPVSLNPCLS